MDYSQTVYLLTQVPPAGSYFSQCQLGAESLMNAICASANLRNEGCGLLRNNRFIVPQPPEYHATRPI